MSVYSSSIWRIVTYLENCHFPLYGNNSFEYYPLGEDAFEAIIADLEKAEKFIFLEFFIVADGVLWQRIKNILIDKASHGVEIKFLYDDYGSMFRTSKQLWQEIKDAGVEVAEFNSIGKYLDKLYLNYRSHQKIVVIDGKVGYTGGFNLADEYVNEVERFGIWKDTGVRIEGDGVFGLTAIFLQMWTMTVEKTIDDYNIYRYSEDFSTVTSEKDITLDEKKSNENQNNDNGKSGFCQVIADGPANNPENPIADTILQLIYSSSKYLYITTPYLVLDQKLIDNITQAARSGVDVRVITPHIYDKWYVYQVNVANYGPLLKSGVKVYEYTPGFCHAKMGISADVFATCGTINLDYRSFYHHFENGVLIYNNEVITDIKRDFSKTFNECREVTERYKKTAPGLVRLANSILRLAAPFL